MEQGIKVSFISDGIWQFNESNENGPYVDAYLICGKNRALAVDCLQTLPGLYGEMRKLTTLPIDLIITHGHGDHAGAALMGFHEAGCRIYMDAVDFPILQGFSSLPVEKDWFSPIQPGMVFDLGGFCFQVLPVPGHTPGCLVLLEEEKQLLFSGDSIGSGHFWMQLPHSLPLDCFCRGLQQLWGRVENLPGLRVYPGHRNQSPVQLTGQYVKDTLTITEELISGQRKGEAMQMPWHGGVMKYACTSYGQMLNYCYDPEKIVSTGRQEEL